MTDEPGLKPCPFCGREANFQAIQGNNPQPFAWDVIHSCAVGHGAGWIRISPRDANGRGTRQMAADAWNTRAGRALTPPDDLPARVKEGGDGDKLVADLREESRLSQRTAWDRADGGQDYCIAAQLADAAADRIEMQAARIAELEAENARLMFDLAAKGPWPKPPDGARCSPPFYEMDPFSVQYVFGSGWTLFKSSRECGSKCTVRGYDSAESALAAMVHARAALAADSGAADA